MLYLMRSKILGCVMLTNVQWNQWNAQASQCLSKLEYTYIKICFNFFFLLLILFSYQNVLLCFGCGYVEYRI